MTQTFLPLFTLTFLLIVFVDPVLADNCGSLSDCYTMTRDAIIATAAIGIGISLVLDFLPIIGDFKGIVEAIRGKDLITGERLKGWQRILSAIPVIGRFSKLAKIVDASASAAKISAERAISAAQKGDFASATKAANAAQKAADEAKIAAQTLRNLGKNAKPKDLAKVNKAVQQAARAADKSQAVLRPKKQLQIRKNSQQGNGNKPNEKNEWIDQAGNIRWPPQGGFASPPKTQVLSAGTKIDRYGEIGGVYASPKGTPYSQRSLAPGSEQKPYNIYEIIRPVKVEGGKVSPWFGESGGGIQYKFNEPISQLIKKGILRKVN